MKKNAIDKLRTASDAERIGASTIELFGELADVREWAEALTELADMIEQVEAAVQDYVDAEDREEKAGFKDEALTQLNELIELWDNATALPDINGLLKAQ